MQETADGLQIRPGRLHGGVFHAYDDHRLAQAAAVLGPRRAGRRGGRHRDDGQDVPRLRRRVGGDARVSPRAIGEDDFDSYDRPRRHTRPRTKDRPSYPDAVPGFVVTVDRGRFTVRVGDRRRRRATSTRSRHARSDARVSSSATAYGSSGDDSGDEGALARIIEVLDRTTVLRRSSDDSDPVERILVANATQLVIVASIADPPPRPRLIDRCLVAAYAAGMRPLLLPDEGRPGRPRRAALDLPGARRVVGGHPARIEPRPRSWIGSRTR